MKATVIELSPQKYEAFNVLSGFVDDKSQVVEGERVGVAFLKGKSKVFSLRLWMFDARYFVAPDDNDPAKYDLLALEEYTSRDGEEKCSWRRVGSGEVCGNYLKLNFFLLERALFLALFPVKREAS